MFSHQSLYGACSIQMIRSHACPSLVALQFGYAQTFDEGRAFVDDVLARMSVEELVRLVTHELGSLVPATARTLQMLILSLSCNTAPTQASAL